MRKRRTQTGVAGHDCAGTAGASRPHNSNSQYERSTRQLEYEIYPPPSVVPPQCHCTFTFKYACTVGTLWYTIRYARPTMISVLQTFNNIAGTLCNCHYKIDEYYCVTPCCVDAVPLLQYLEFTSAFAR